MVDDPMPEIPEIAFIPLPNKTNGGESPEELAVRHGIANYHRVITERDDYARQLTTAERLIAVAKIEIEGLRAQLDAERTRVICYQTERDDAVVVCSGLEAALESMMAIGRTFQTKNVPMIRKIEEK